LASLWYNDIEAERMKFYLLKPSENNGLKNCMWTGAMHKPFVHGVDVTYFDLEKKLTGVWHCGNIAKKRVTVENGRRQWRKLISEGYSVYLKEEDDREGMYDKLKAHLLKKDLAEYLEIRL
jgi:hypothetical protein